MAKATTSKNLAAKTLGSAGGVFSDVLNVGGALFTLHDSFKNGDNPAIAVAKAGSDFAFGELTSSVGSKLFGGGLLGGVVGMGAYMALTTGYDMMVQESFANAKAQSTMASTGSGRVGSGTFNMSQAGYTMRQRALNKIRNNGQQINSVLGSEARTYLKAARNYE